MKSQRKHIVRNILLIILLLLAVAGLWSMLSHGSKPTEDELKAHPHRLSVLTWNTNRLSQFRKPEKNEVLQYLIQQDADVICLQEVDVYKSKEFLTLPEVKQFLGAKYPYSYLDFSVYDSRHQFGTMIWSRFPLINKHSILYETRGNLSNRCDILVDGDTIRLIGNHLESYNFTQEELAFMDSIHNYQVFRSTAKRMEEKWERATPLRNKQARIVRTEIDQSPYPVIVVGDFNSIPLSYAYRHICKGMKDAWVETSWGKWGATCEKRGIGMRIDYIISSPDLIPLQCSVIKTSGSDHWPVVASLAW